MRFHLLAAAVLGVTGMLAAPPPRLMAQTPARPVSDLASQVEGEWHGSVTSDIRGSSRTGVTITVVRISPNRVRVSCDYPRIPTVEVDLMEAGGSIMNVRPGVTFLVELQRDANRLDLYIAEASLIVRRR